MKHNIRINGSVKQIDCELGSGILDKNGKEIFEGDRVSAPPEMVSEAIGDTAAVGTVFYEAGTWLVAFPCAQDILELYLISTDIEIVGHVNAPPFKDTGRAWSPQLHDAYNRLLDAFIARKSPETLCEAALAVVKAAKADNRFDGD